MKIMPDVMLIIDTYLLCFCLHQFHSTTRRIRRERNPSMHLFKSQ